MFDFVELRADFVWSQTLQAWHATTSGRGTKSHPQPFGCTKLLGKGRKKTAECTALPNPATLTTAESLQKDQKKKRICAAIRVPELCLTPCIPALEQRIVILQVLHC